MNNLIESTYVLHMLWGYMRYLIYKYNLRYLVLPVIYLTIILLVVPASSTIVNTFNYKEMDSFTVVVLTKEEKIQNILEKYDLSEYQFKVLCGIVLSEAEYNSYDDAYAVINTIYNRTHSKNWVKSVDNKFGQGKGMNLYYQAISPNQFVVYQSGSYLKHINDTNNSGYDAIIDFLYSENTLHNYLSFRSHSIKVNGSKSYSKNGNNYFNEIKEENRI